MAIYECEEHDLLDTFQIPSNTGINMKMKPSEGHICNVVLPPQVVPFCRDNSHPPELCSTAPA